MGFRTVVLLENDRTSDWQNDPKLGQKILDASHACGRGDSSRHFSYGSALECVHADTETLAIITSYHMEVLNHSTRSWSNDKSDNERQLNILKEAARKLGYRLTKIHQK